MSDLPKENLPAAAATDDDDRQLTPKSDGLDRRHFLKFSSAAAAVAVATPGLAKDKKQYGAAPKRQGTAKDLKGGWFVV